MIAGNRPMTHVVVLQADTARALVAHAVRRGISIAALATRIVDTVVHEAMIDAVLDDGAAGEDAGC